MIIRQKYLDELEKWRDSDLVKIITGMRRCGKSTLLRQFAKTLPKNGVNKSHLILLDCSDLSLQKEITTAQQLHDYLLSRLPTKGRSYILLDEILSIPDWHQAIKSLSLRSHVDCYLTDSNSSSLSQQASTYLTGRHLRLNLLPLSFNELLTCARFRQSPTKVYQYLTQSSGLPAVLKLKNQADINQYLQTVFNDFISENVIDQYHLPDKQVLTSIIEYLLSNLGEILFVNSIAATMTIAKIVSLIFANRISNDAASGKGKTNPHTVDAYLGALIDSQLFHKVPCYHFNGRHTLHTGDKFYVGDFGLSQCLTSEPLLTQQQVLENMVYLQLKQQGGRISAAKKKQGFIDFIVTNAHQQKSYYQVLYSTQDEQALTQKLAPLNEVNPQAPKTLITLDPNPVTISDSHLQSVNFFDWVINN